MKINPASEGKLKDFVSYVQLGILSLVVISSVFVVLQLYAMQKAFVDFQTHLDEHIAGLQSGSDVAVEPTPEVRYFKNVVSFKDDPYKGDPKTAKIAIVEYGDFECPYCAQAEAKISQILADNPNVFYVFKNYPLPYHDRAKPAAIAALCAFRQGKYWELHKILFNNQTNLGQEYFNQYAKEINLDVAKFTGCLSDQQVSNLVDITVNEGMELKISGTPSFIVGKISSVDDKNVGIDGQIVYMNDLNKVVEGLK